MGYSGQGEPDGAKKNPFFCWAGGNGNRRMANSPDPDGMKAKGDNRIFHKRGRKIDSSDTSTPIRRDRVEEAKRKRLNGDYDSQEVYQKIAERLMDIFGI